MSFERLAPERFDTIPDVAEPSESPVLIGHEEAMLHVAGAYRAGKLHHALLLSGPPGIGKATFAFHLAEHLVANPVPADAPSVFAPRDPQSALFRQIAQGSHPSVLHLTRPANDKTKGFKSAVTVDEVRRVNRFLGMTSSNGGYRVAIVDPADDMNTNAANALLKNLEEPPPRTLFILIAHSPGALLPTIRSRCQTIKFKPLADSELLRVLQALHTPLPGDEAARAALAAKAGGSVRDALLMTQFGGLDITEAMSAVLDTREFDVAEAWRIAEVVGGRDNAVQFAIFNQAALDMTADAARKAALAGDSSRAAALSELWRESDRAIAETNTYNLDKKQHVCGLLQKMVDAFRS